jgi:probable addiction module antidote protein
MKRRIDEAGMWKQIEDVRAGKGLNPSEIVDFLNEAFHSGDVDRISQAIGTAAKVHDISAIAKRAGLSRTTVYRAFAGEGTHPNLTTVLRVLEAMGLGLKVGRIRNSGARGSRLCRGAFED